jgi:hypothetical protein
MIVIPGESESLLLVSRFDPAKDDYDEMYTIYSIPAGLDLSGSWDQLEAQATRNRGSVRTAMVQFDGTRRCQIDVSSLMLTPW